MKESRAIDIYNNQIVPKIKEMDIFLKTEENIPFEQVCNILNITKTQLENILKNINENHVNNKNFMYIILNGDSFICNVIKREIQCGSPYLYTPKQIAYIYDLDYQKVKEAYDFLNLDKITSKEIPAILIQI